MLGLLETLPSGLTSLEAAGVDPLPLGPDVLELERTRSFTASSSTLDTAARLKRACRLSLPRAGEDSGFVIERSYPGRAGPSTPFPT